MTRSRDGRLRRAALRLLVGAGAVVALGGVGAFGVVALLDRAEPPPPVRCVAVVDDASWSLETDQAETAALLAGMSIQRGMPARAATIAIATGMQESRLRNIDYGDRDSVGIFQQRPSQGWGSVEQIMDPVYATTAFYDALAKVDGYESMEVTVAAQTVQRSAFPDAYAQHEGRSRAWASALTGHSPRAVTCTLPDADGADRDGLLARLERDLGITATPTDDGVRVDAASLAGPADQVARKAWAVAHWAVAVARPFGVVGVHVGDHVWDRANGVWTPAAAPLGDGVVAVALAG